MERNWDTIRDILLEVESITEPTAVLRPESDVGWRYVEHMVLLIDAGYCTGHVLRDVSGWATASITSLTWEGYDLLDSIRDEDVWTKMKNTLSEFSGKASVEVLKALATSYVKQQLGLTG